MTNTSGYFTITADDAVGVVVNNLGGTSNLELAVMANDTIRYLGMFIFLLVMILIVLQWMLGKSML